MELSESNFDNYSSLYKFAIIRLISNHNNMKCKLYPQDDLNSLPKSILFEILNLISIKKYIIWLIKNKRIDTIFEFFTNIDVMRCIFRSRDKADSEMVRKLFRKFKTLSVILTRNFCDTYNTLTFSTENHVKPPAWYFFTFGLNLGTFFSYAGFHIASRKVFQIVKLKFEESNMKISSLFLECLRRKLHTKIVKFGFARATKTYRKLRSLIIREGNPLEIPVFIKTIINKEFKYFSKIRKNNVEKLRRRA